MLAIALIALAQIGTSQPPVAKVGAQDFGRCVADTATKFAKSIEGAEVVVDAAIAKCRPIMERYIADAPSNSLAAMPSAQEQSRRVLIQLAREDALVRVLEIRSK